MTNQDRPSDEPKHSAEGDESPESACQGCPPSAGEHKKRMFAVHNVTSPQQGVSNQAVRITTGQPNAFICVTGVVSTISLLNKKVFAAVYRTFAEIPASPPAGTPFGNISALNGVYIISRVENVMLGSSNCIGIWIEKTAPSSGAPGEYVYPHKFCFVVVEDSVTYCDA